MKSCVRAVLLSCLVAAPLAARAQVTVSISQPYAQLMVGKSLQFSATVGGTSNHGITWQVNNANSGTTASGKITKTGLYTAPSSAPYPAIATITAVSKADPSVSATATVTLLTQAQGGSVYYVAPGGDDAGAGSVGDPWKTVQHAADTAVAGDNVFVRQGVYNEHVTFTRSGELGALHHLRELPGRDGND